MRVAYKNALAFLLIAVAYVISGKAALMLALPPGYASAIFPPAGVAVAAAYIIGNRALPGIFLGAFLLNIWAGHSISGSVLVAAVAIAVASTLQALAGGWLLRRAIGYPAAFDRARDIFSFLLLAPVASLISATLSVAALWALGVFGTRVVSENWFTWWAGDLLGIITLLPIAMAFFGEPRDLWRRRLRTMAIPMVPVFALFVLLFLKINQWEQNESLNEFRQISEQSLHQIRVGLEEQDAVLAGMRGLFVHDPEGHISRQEFRRFTRSFLARFPMIQAFEWAPSIESSRRPGFEASERKAIPGFEIRERDANGLMTRAAERSRYYPVTYAEPIEGNETAVGFDLASTPRRLETLSRSAQEGVPVATAPIVLIQARQQTGMLIMQSVQLQGRGIGVVLIALKVGDFINRVLPPASASLHLRLVDDDAQTVIYDNFGPVVPRIVFERAFEFGGRHYRFQSMPTETYLEQHRGWQSWGVLATAALGIALLEALLLLGTGYTVRVETQVRQRTRELKDSESRLLELFENLSSGVAVFEVSPEDYDFTVVSLNAAAERIDKVSRRNMIGRSVADLFPLGGENGLLDVLKRVWESGKAEHHPTFVFRQGQIVEWRDIYVYKLPNGEIVVIYNDITQAKQLEQQMHHLAHYDTLTDLPNRALFSDRLRLSLAAARRGQTHLAVMLIDLDQFKSINDTLGHDIGDLLLKEVAVRMQRCVRESDTISRMGGDEFIVLLPSIETEPDVMTVAEKILYVLNQPFELAGHEIHISSSIGIAIYPEHGDEDKSLLKNADIAMYFAKQSGRNNAKLFQPDMLKDDR